MNYNYGRIGSWEGKDVIRVNKNDYDNGSEIKPARFIYAVDNLIGDGNTYLIRNNVVFAQLLNEHGDINMIEERKYYRPVEFETNRKKIPEVERKVRFNNAEGEFVFNKETVTFNENAIPKGTSRGMRADNKTVDDWIGFGMNATVEEILKGKK